METHLHRRLHPRLYFHRRLAQSVADIYRQVLALSLSGFLHSSGRLKSWRCCSWSTIPRALGAFLLKDENTDSDVTQISAAHITSCWREEGLTAVLYPHHRIKMTELVKPGPGPAKPPQIQPQ